MNFDTFLFVLFIFFISIIFQSIWINKLKKMQIYLVQKKYGPSSHLESKSKTPVMGGVVFIVTSVVGIILNSVFFGGVLRNLCLVWGFPVLASLVGLCDDWMKLSSGSSEGLSSLKKLGLQILISISWSLFFVLSHGVQLWPGYTLLSKPLSVILLTFLSVGILNAMNVTDGLDGLASGAAAISFLAIIINREFDPMITIPCLMGLVITTSFLWHNANPARIFMGDVGSHFLGALLISLCAYGNFLLFILPAAFLFGVEILSVCIQLVAIYVFNRKVFLMSPIHHHFELLGWTENQIVMRFWLIHGLGILILSQLLAKIIF